MDTRISKEYQTKAHFVIILLINVVKCLIKFETNKHIPTTLNEQQLYMQTILKNSLKMALYMSRNM
jgi:hypothetical protein